VQATLYHVFMQATLYHVIIHIVQAILYHVIIHPLRNYGTTSSTTGNPLPCDVTTPSSAGNPLPCDHSSFTAFTVPHHLVKATLYHLLILYAHTLPHQPFTILETDP
jgi:hypothetical protein